MAAVALGHGELLHPVDQVRVVAVTPRRLDDEGPVFEGNEASAEEAAQAKISFSKPSPGPRFLFLSPFPFFFLPTPRGTLQILYSAGIVLHPITGVKDKDIF